MERLYTNWLIRQMRGFIDNLSIILSDVDMGNLYPDVMKYPFPVSFSVPSNWYWSFI